LKKVLGIALLVCGLLLSGCTKKETVPKYEQVKQAEDGILKGVKVSKKVSGYSGKGYVTNFNEPQDSVTFKVKAPSEGIYTLKIRYRVSTGSGDKHTKIVLNGEPSREMILPESNEFRETTGIKIMLNKGENVIQFVSEWGYYDLDYIKVQSESSHRLDNKENKLVNPKATKETKSLMHFLTDQYGKSILSGQQDLTEVEWLNNNIGKKPAIVGFDFLDYSNSALQYERNSKQVEQAIQWDKEGGIVTFSWHWIAPKHLTNKPGKEWDTGYLTKSTTFDVQYAMTHPNSEEYKLLLNDIDTIAIQLKKLQKANIPILFRPLHEAEGGWFWWGAKGPEPAKKLYILLYDRLTNYHKINNLIWVWNSVSPEWYPGDKYVDIISYDSYPSAGDYLPVSIPYDRALSLVNNRKMVTLSENGPIPDPDLLKKYQVSWSWFLTWRGHFLKNGKLNDIDHLTKVYNSPYVITLDELPNLKSYK
jgi:mannan endo-1,4-beta-mannosidase